MRGEEERSGVGMKRDGERRVVAGRGGVGGSGWTYMGGVGWRLGRRGGRGVVRGRWA